MWFISFAKIKHSKTFSRVKPIFKRTVRYPIAIAKPDQDRPGTGPRPNNNSNGSNHGNPDNRTDRQKQNRTEQNGTNRTKRTQISNSDNNGTGPGPGTGGRPGQARGTHDTPNGGTQKEEGKERVVPNPLANPSALPCSATPLKGLRTPKPPCSPRGFALRPPYPRFHGT